MHPLAAIVWKDLLLDLRTKEMVIPMLIFALLVCVIFNFVFDPAPKIVIIVVPGVLWVSFTFAGILGLTRSFMLEKECESIEGLMVCPISRDTIYLGKFLSSFMLLIIFEFIMLPIFSILYDLPIFLPELWLVVILTTFGFSAVGTPFSMMAVNTRAKEVMLPLIYFPIVVPAIIAAVETTGRILQGDPWGSYAQWLGLLVAFDAVFLVVATLTFDSILGE